MRFHRALEKSIHERVRYRWLGDEDFHLVANVAPRPGRVLCPLPGSKGDTRDPALTIT